MPLVALCARVVRRSAAAGVASARRPFSSSSSAGSSSSAASPVAKSFNLAIMGAPGVGKGTFASRLSPMFGIPMISMGDLLRAEIKAGSVIGQQVKALTESGGLVGDDIALQLLKQRLEQPDAKPGFLLDGYPRRISQADTLGALRPIQLAVNLTLDESVLVEKALARRICERCGTGYNLANIQRNGYEMPPLLPRVAGQCDKCAGRLVTRADDTEAIIRERLAVYQRETLPIVDYYRSRGVLLEFEVKKGVADLPDLANAIQAKLTKK